jgi:hypothetical protein
MTYEAPSSSSNDDAAVAATDDGVQYDSTDDRADDAWRYSNYAANSNYYNYNQKNDDATYNDDTYSRRTMRRKLGNNNNQYSSSSSNKIYGYYKAADDDADKNTYYNDDHYSSSTYVVAPWYIGSSGQCIYQTSCNNYESACTDWTGSSTRSSTDDVGDSANSSSSHPYGACTVSTSSSQKGGYYYAGPHCASDGRTIQVALFTDSSCAQYKSDATLSDGSGSSFEKYYDKTCIKCNAAKVYGLESEFDIGDDDGNGRSSASSSSLQSVTNPVCAAMYDSAAKCNRYLPNLQYSTTGKSGGGDDDANPDGSSAWNEVRNCVQKNVA